MATGGATVTLSTTTLVGAAVTHRAAPVGATSTRRIDSASYGSWDRCRGGGWLLFDGIALDGAFQLVLRHRADMTVGNILTCGVAQHETSIAGLQLLNQILVLLEAGV